MRNDGASQYHVTDGEHYQGRIAFVSELMPHPQRQNWFGQQDDRQAEHQCEGNVQQPCQSKHAAGRILLAGSVTRTEVWEQKIKRGRAKAVDRLRYLNAYNVDRD